MNREYEAFKLAKFFLQERRKKTYKTFKLNSVKSSKWWHFFVNIVNKFSDKDEWNARDFILSNFAYNSDVLPYELLYDKAWEVFLEYRHRFKPVDNRRNIVLGLLDTFNKVKEWNGKNNFDIYDFEKFFSNGKVKFFIKRGNYNTYLFTICKHFPRELMDENEYEAKRAIIFSDKKILNKMKKVLGEEFK